jgi:hypothetical protein
MDIVSEQKQISNDEKIQISKQVKADLIDHLYQGCLPGTITGIVTSAALFFDYYHFTNTALLIAWLTIFNCMMLSLIILYFAYRKFKQKISLKYWEWAYSFIMSGCALS